MLNESIYKAFILVMTDADTFGQRFLNLPKNVQVCKKISDKKLKVDLLKENK